MKGMKVAIISPAYNKETHLLLTKVRSPLRDFFFELQETMEKYLFSVMSG